MSDYSAMSVHELLQEYASAEWQGYYRGLESAVTLESAIRKAVIREASVGHVSIRIRALDGFPTVDGLVLLKEAIPNDWSEYDLVPKEREP